MNRYDIALGKLPPPEPLIPSASPSNKLLIAGIRQSGKTEMMLNEMIKFYRGNMLLLAGSSFITRHLRERLEQKITESNEAHPRHIPIERRYDSEGFKYPNIYSLDSIFCEEIQTAPAEMYSSGIDTVLTALSKTKTKKIVATCDLPEFFQASKNWPQSGLVDDPVYDKVWRGQYENSIETTQFKYDSMGDFDPIIWDVVFLPCLSLIRV